jgi:hypothetical protein
LDLQANKQRQRRCRSNIEQPSAESFHRPRLYGDSVDVLLNPSNLISICGKNAFLRVFLRALRIFAVEFSPAFATLQESGNRLVIVEPNIELK